MEPDIEDIIEAGHKYYEWKIIIGKLFASGDCPLEMDDACHATLGILQKNFVELVKARVALQVRHAELEERLLREIQELQS
jgi:hypothetical protein